MKCTRIATLFAAVTMSFCIAGFTTGCGGQAAPEQSQSEQEAAQESVAVEALADGTYVIEADTDSSMFRADSCTLTVADGAYTATLVLPGEGFSRLYFGTADEAAKAADDAIYDYRLNDEGKYTFDIPVAALDEELQVAAYGQRRDTWYDHTITFHAPEAATLADAA